MGSTRQGIKMRNKRFKICWIFLTSQFFSQLTFLYPTFVFSCIFFFLKFIDFSLNSQTTQKESTENTQKNFLHVDWILKSFSNSFFKWKKVLHYLFTMWFTSGAGYVISSYLTVKCILESMGGKREICVWIFKIKI